MEGVDEPSSFALNNNFRHLSPQLITFGLALTLGTRSHSAAASLARGVASETRRGENAEKRILARYRYSEYSVGKSELPLYSYHATTRLLPRVD